MAQLRSLLLSPHLEVLIKNDKCYEGLNIDSMFPDSVSHYSALHNFVCLTVDGMLTDFLFFVCSSYCIHYQFSETLDYTGASGYFSLLIYEISSYVYGPEYTFLQFFDELSFVCVRVLEAMLNVELSPCDQNAS